MTWTKLSDDFSDDCWRLSAGEFRLHVEALVWSNRKLLDCVIPKDDLRRFASDPQFAQNLVAVGWWTENTGTYTIRHHAAYQRTREQVVKRQQTSAANGAKGGRPPSREQADDLTRDNPVDNPVGNPPDNPQGQDRTGQALEPEPPTKLNAYGIGDCRQCQSFEKLGEDGLCSACFVEANVQAGAVNT